MQFEFVHDEENEVKYGWNIESKHIGIAMR